MFGDDEDAEDPMLRVGGGNKLAGYGETPGVTDGRAPTDRLAVVVTVYRVPPSVYAATVFRS